MAKQFFKRFFLIFGPDLKNTDSFYFYFYLIACSFLPRFIHVANKFMLHINMKLFQTSKNFKNENMLGFSSQNCSKTYFWLGTEWACFYPQVIKCFFSKTGLSLVVVVPIFCLPRRNLSIGNIIRISSLCYEHTCILRMNIFMMSVSRATKQLMDSPYRCSDVDQNTSIGKCNDDR